MPRLYEVFRPELTIVDGAGGAPKTIPALRKFVGKKGVAKKLARVWNGEQNDNPQNPIVVRVHVLRGKAAIVDFLNELTYGTKPIRVKSVGKVKRTDGRTWKKAKAKKSKGKKGGAK